MSNQGLFLLAWLKFNNKCPSRWLRQDMFFLTVPLKNYPVVRFIQEESFFQRYLFDKIVKIILYSTAGQEKIIIYFKDW